MTKQTIDENLLMKYIKSMNPSKEKSQKINEIYKFDESIDNKSMKIDEMNQFNESINGKSMKIDGMNQFMNPSIENLWKSLK